VTKSETGNETRAQLRNGGFSLLELILVLVVISLVMAIAYPSMSRGKTAFHLRAVARDVINSLRVAREAAVTEQKSMMVVIDAQAQQITVSDDVGEGARKYRPPNDVKVLGLTSTGEEGLQGPLVIRFSSNGSSDNAQILIKADTGANLKIIVDPLIGSARIQSNEGVKAP
jgi:prepilin-type N-terminal cleavage/methylation domain-containing protein